MECFDVFIVGGGAAGLSAARAAADQGCKRILLVDCCPKPGGILRQCIHRGFGSGELTGPEYIKQLLTNFPKDIHFLWNTMVLFVNEDRIAVLSSREFGLKKIKFKQMILATGCREISAGELDITGTRPNGIFTAGQLQKDMNLRGFVPQGPAVILGSGDVGLVMAWQLIHTGLEIKMLVEKKEKCAGLVRNWQRLEGFSLPVRTACTISKVWGEVHLEGVSVRDLNAGREEYVPCRTLVIAAGLRPEQELVRKLGQQPWLQLCGNCRLIHGVVEGVIQEGIQAGKLACEKLRE